MGMSIDEAIRDLVYLKGCGIFPFSYGTDGKQLTIATDECIAIAIDTMRKYQMFQLDYKARLKADMVAMLTDIQLEIEEKEQYYQNEFLESKNAVHDAAMCGRMFGCGECKELIQQKINALKGE